jgi:hypothetical protein
VCNEIDENHTQNGKYVSHFYAAMFRHKPPPQGAPSVKIFSSPNSFIARVILKNARVDESLFHFNVDHHRL